MPGDEYINRICPQPRSGDDNVKQFVRFQEGDPVQPTGAFDLERFYQGEAGSRVSYDGLKERAASLKQVMDRRRNGTVVFDIDGVLADSRWRLPLIREEGVEAIIENRGQLGEAWDKDRFPNVGVMMGDREERWSNFYGLMPWDEPYKSGGDLYKRFRGTHAVELWTGRSEWTREITLKWLVKHDLLPMSESQRRLGEPLSDEDFYEWSKVWLHMRPNQSRKPGWVVKTDWLKLFQDEDLPDPILVIDDDPDIVAAFEQVGVPALLATWHGEGVERVRG